MSRLRLMCGNLRTMMHKLIRQAGLTPWVRTWQNLWASRATELADAFPSHVAAAWLGHISEIADKHYRSVTDDHFDRAAKSVAKSAAVGSSFGVSGNDLEKRPERKEPEKQALPAPVAVSQLSLWAVLDSNQ